MSPNPALLTWPRAVAPSDGLIVFDDFNRANGALGGDWFSQGSAWTVASNQATAGSSTSTALHPVGSATDYYVQAKMMAFSGSSFGVVARFHATNQIGYLWRYNGSNMSLFVSATNNNYVQIGSSYTVSLSSGDVLRLEVEGTTIRGLVNGVVRASGTNSQVSSGAAGMRGFNSSSGFMDDFEVGAL